MLHKREVGRQSYASLVTHLTDENHTLSIAVSLLPIQRACCRPALFIVKYVTTLTKGLMLICYQSMYAVLLI